MTGCRAPLFPTPPTEERAAQFCAENEPVAESAHFAVHRVPNGLAAAEVAAEMEAVVRALRGWLPPEALPQARACRVVVYGAEEAEGRRFIRHRSLSGRAAGVAGLDMNLIVAAGRPSEARLLTVLRHEAVHWSLHRQNARPLPFWVNEGVAALLEEGVRADGTPLPNPERRSCVRRNRETARQGIRRVLAMAPFEPGDRRDYAWAWALVHWQYVTRPREASPRDDAHEGTGYPGLQLPWWLDELHADRAEDYAAAVLRALGQ